LSGATVSHDLFDGRHALKTPMGLVALAGVAAVMICRAIYLVFYYAPLEANMGFVQKIFYFHVPSAWNMMLSVLIMGIASIGYLIKKTDAWDRLTDSSIELAMVFGTMVVFSGPLWARKAWGVYWVWDARLTSTLVLVLTLIAAKIARQYAGAASKQITAGLAIFAVLDMGFVYFCVQFFTTNHPMNDVKSQLEPRMATTLWFCALTFLVIYVCLLWSRLRLGKLRTALDRLHMHAVEAGIDD
jgi:heme exporter protein C